MSLSPGQKLLHYEIVEQIGEGGMGIVWKALDTTLQREVAIKVLPAALAQDPDRLARFDREAKLLASLSHANIAAVFGLHEAGDIRFLAMEYVAGEDLAKRLAHGRIPLSESLGYARQIADALQAAHESGVVHRDLKPANILLTTDDEIKVLDFGLAKAFEADPSAAVSPSMSPTLTSHGTMAGVILGTAGYMSPEQARGHEADKRSDVWSFGVVLYEMITGTRSFHGDTVSDTLASVLKLEPDWSQLPADLPRGIARLLKRCLQKDPRDRLHDIADARIEIVEALEKPAPDTAQPRAASRGLAAGLAVLGLAAGGLTGWFLKPAAPDSPVRRFVIRSDDVTKQPNSPRISPDGSKIVYRTAGSWYVRDLQGWESRLIEGSDDAENPFWSPDGSSIAYHAKNKLWKVALPGGTPMVICGLTDMTQGAWNEAGTIGIVTSYRLLEVSSRGGEPEAVLDLSDANVNDFHGIDVLPGDHGWVVVVHESTGTFGVDVVRGTERRRLVELENTTLWSPRYAHPGHVLYRRFGKNQGIWAVPFSLASGEATGAPFIVTAAGNNASASRDGTLIYRPGGSTSNHELVGVGRDGVVVGTFGQPQDLWHPQLSPDGSRVLVSAQENEGWDLWIHDVTRGTKTRLTATDDREGLARWSPDGTRVYFYSPVGNSLSRIYSVSADGSGEPSDLTGGKTLSLSADGRFMAFVREGEETGDDLWSWALDGESEPEVFLATDADELSPSISPDGKWLAYSSQESGRYEVYIKPFPSGPGKWQVSVDGGARPSWSPDGKRVYFAHWQGGANELSEVDVEVGSDLRLSAPRLVLDFRADSGGRKTIQVWRGYEMHPDGQSVLGIRQVDDGEEEDENAMPGGIFVVQNWLAEFRE